jgi:hypothetical protein
MSETAYPLSWPLGYPRTGYRRESSFGTRRSVRGRITTLSQVIGLLQAELDRLGARKAVLSTNVELRLDGLPRSNGSRACMDPGVAVYFELKGKRIVLPCDKWDRVECNLMAVVKHIEATRGLERWGVGTIERSFEGYLALPEKGTQMAWYDVLRIPPNADAALIDQTFRLLAKVAHPDAGGNLERWHELNTAREQGLAAAAGNPQSAIRNPQ